MKRNLIHHLCSRLPDSATAALDLLPGSSGLLDRSEAQGEGQYSQELVWLNSVGLPMLPLRKDTTICWVTDVSG